MKRWFKVYLVTVPVMYILGTIWSVINGYRYFCDGWKSCDNDGNVIELEIFLSRGLNGVVITLVGSAIIAYFILRMIDEDKKKKESDSGD